MGPPEVPTNSLLVSSFQCHHLATAGSGRRKQIFSFVSRLSGRESPTPMTLSKRGAESLVTASLQPRGQSVLHDFPAIFPSCRFFLFSCVAAWVREGAILEFGTMRQTKKMPCQKKKKKKKKKK